MTDKKLTDNEIVKALEICSNNGDCKECPINPHHGNYGYCTSLAIKATLDLINRQKAEKAEQQSEIAILKDSNKNLQELYYTEREKVKKAKQKVIDIAKALKTAKAEAYKEFAERLKEAPIKCALPLSGLSTKDEIEDYFNDIMLQVRDVIDNLKKELVGEQNG